MEEIRINHSVWKSLLVGLVVFVPTAMFFKFAVKINLSGCPSWGLPFGLGLYGLFGLYLLLVFFKERVLRRPFIRITEDGLLIINRLLRKKIIKLHDVRGFRCGYWDYNMGPYFLNIGYMPEMEQQHNHIWLDFMETNAEKVVILLNKLRKMSKSKHRSQTLNEKTQRNKLRKFIKEYNKRTSFWSF